MFLGLVALVVLGSVLMGSSISAQGKEKKGAQKGKPALKKSMTAEERAKKTDDRMKKRLGATDDQWKTLGPKVMKVSTLSRLLSSNVGRGRTTSRPKRDGGGGKRGAGRSDREPRGGRGREKTALQKSASDLRKILANKQAKPEEITKGLTAYRKIRADAKAELAKAQKKLDKEVSGRLEAQLVLMGLLD
jgi:hypothetical protein